jgi:histidinol-phosphate/aromatic aminotransferase/cobyric acid decarboxylase-like protein
MTISTWRTRLSDSLRELGFGPVPSAAPFVLVHVGRRAEQIVRSLGERRIAVRWCASFGLPDHVRIAVRPPTEQDLLIAALRALQADLRT